MTYLDKLHSIGRDIALHQLVFGHLTFAVIVMFRKQKSSLFPTECMNKDIQSHAGFEC